MSANSSSSSNVSFPPLNFDSFVNFNDELQHCLISKVGTFSITAFTITSVLVILPLCIIVLYLGHKQWSQQRSSAAISHSDFSTYHVVVADLMSVFGSILMCCGVHTDLPTMIMVGIYLGSTQIYGQMYFHVLTCVERYLAVVHPVTYLSLRKEKWIRIRNTIAGCVWLLGIAGTGFMYLGDHIFFVTQYFCVTSFVLIVICFCSLSVLRVLIRPGPGEGGGDRQRVDQSKLRAFYTITAILGVLLFRVGGNIVGNALYSSAQLGETESCGIMLSFTWLGLPTSLVLPLLFLQRAGKLLCCKSNSERG